jgi:serine protease Do
MEQQELIDLLDCYAKGTLTAEESLRVEERIRDDERFRALAEEHLKLIGALKAYDKRERLKNVLDEIHATLPEDYPLSLSPEEPSLPAKSWRGYWPLTAVAASVAVISVLATVFITRSSMMKQSAEYKELSRDVEQIQQSQQQIIADISEKQKADVLPGKYRGTGFLITAKGYVVTSYHVIKGADSVYIENEKWGRHKVTVLHSDPENDLSILVIEKEPLPIPRSLPYTISDAEASLGEEVFTLGFPREDIVFGEGSVSALTGYRQNPGAYQVSVPVNPGNSGGPLLNAKGDLIGIISGLQTETSGAAFATKASVLREVINQMPPDSVHAPLVLPRQNSLRGISRVEQVKRWKDFVFMVRVYN